MLELLFADPSLVTRRLVDDVLKYKRIDGVTESLRTLRDGVLAGEHIDLDELDAPVLVIWGAQDRIIAQPAGELRVIESSGHSPHMESAAEVNELIRDDAALRAIAGSMLEEGRQRAQIGDRLGGFSGPLLVVWGREDRIIPAEHAERAPEGAQVHVLDGQGHSPHMEAAGEFNRLCEEFLAGARVG